MSNKKVSFANMKLKTSLDTNICKYKDTEIEVLQYLPIDDKYDLVMITLQKSYEDGIYNAMKVDMYFHLYIVYLYTNINFSEKQKEDETKLYDTLKSNGLLDAIIDTMDEDEYNELYRYTEDIMRDLLKKNRSVTALISKFIDDLPKNAEAAQRIVDNFDKEKYQEVINFAKAANGGRPV